MSVAMWLETMAVLVVSCRLPIIFAFGALPSATAGDECDTPPSTDASSLFSESKGHNENELMFFSATLFSCSVILVSVCVLVSRQRHTSMAVDANANAIAVVRAQSSLDPDEVERTLSRARAVGLTEGLDGLDKRSSRLRVQLPLHQALKTAMVEGLSAETLTDEQERQLQEIADAAEAAGLRADLGGGEAWLPELAEGRGLLQALLDLLAKKRSPRLAQKRKRPTGPVDLAGDEAPARKSLRLPPGAKKVINCERKVAQLEELCRQSSMQVFADDLKEAKAALADAISRVGDGPNPTGIGLVPGGKRVRG